MISFAKLEYCQVFEDLSVLKMENKKSYDHTNKEAQVAIIRAADLFFTLACIRKDECHFVH